MLAGKKERMEYQGGDYMLKFRSFPNGFSLPGGDSHGKEEEESKVNNDGISVTLRYFRLKDGCYFMYY